MSGHSKWHSIKHKKGAADAKRGKLFTSLIKEITIAARIGGGDAEGNPRLRTAISAAKGANMPAENIKRATQKGTGELPGLSYEDATYEGYGPNGIAVFIEAVTDNKNRTVSEIRHLFAKNGGNLGQSGCVSHLFQKKGLIFINKSSTDEDKLMTIALEAGAEDLKDSGEVFEVHTAPQNYDDVLEEIKRKEIPVTFSDLSMLPQTTLKIEGKSAQQILRLMESLEDHDDVQRVFSNFDIDEAEMEKVVS